MALHLCEMHTDSRQCGAAIYKVEEDEEGKFWATNGEYSSRVDYCPVCGAKAPNAKDIGENPFDLGWQGESDAKDSAE